MKATRATRATIAALVIDQTGDAPLPTPPFLVLHAGSLAGYAIEFKRGFAGLLRFRSPRLCVVCEVMKALSPLTPP